MPLLNGIHHVTFLTSDLDRLIRFYARVFDSPVLLDLEEEGLRHAFIQLGPQTVLHPFQVPGVEVPQERMPMFGRGRLDHIALNASSEEAFRELHRRLVDAGATDGIVTNMGSLLLFTFADPDGMELEVAWLKPGIAPARTLRRAEWTTARLGSSHDVTLQDVGGMRVPG